MHADVKFQAVVLVSLDGVDMAVIYSIDISKVWLPNVIC